jgi:hypothetical protein
MTAYNGLHNKESVVGLSFNKWTVLEYSHKNSSGNWFYTCKCQCGSTGIVSASNLRTGKSKQCKSCATKKNGRKGIYAKNAGTDLYVIKCNEYYKIGTTLNLEERLRTIASGNPYELEVVHYAKGEGHKEEYWHKTFEKYHWKGEWYMLNFKHIELIKTGACEIAF